MARNTPWTTETAFSGCNATMATPRQSWLDRLDAWAWRQHQKDREAWLAQSKDLAELEARLRALDRGAPMYR